MAETRLALSKTIDIVEQPGLMGLYQKQMTDIKNIYMDMYKERMFTMSLLKESAWQQSLETLNYRKSVWESTVNAINRRGSREWAIAKSRVDASRDEWLESIEKIYKEESAIWDECIDNFFEQKAAWVEDLATKTSLAGNEHINPANITASAEESIKEAAKGAVLEWSTEKPDASELTANLTGGLFEKLLNSASSTNRIITNTNERVHGYSVQSLDGSGIDTIISNFAGEDREALEKELMMITALRAFETIEDGKVNLEEMIDNANESTRKGIDKTFFSDGFSYKAENNYYTKEVLEDVTAFGGQDYHKAEVDGYIDYDKPTDLLNFSVKVGGKDSDELEKEDFQKMSIRAIERKISTAMSTLSDIRERVFGKPKKVGAEKEYETLEAVDTWSESEKNLFGSEKEKERSGKITKRIEKKDGEFSKHVGYAPTQKSKTDVKATGSIEEFEKVNILFKGAGEMGRIMLEFMRFQMMQTRGWGEFAKSWSERRLYDDDGIPDGFWTGWLKGWTAGGTLDLIMDVAITVMSCVAGPFAILAPLAKLGADAGKMAGDLSRGRDAGEAAVDFGKSAVIAGASVALSAVNIGGKVAEGLGGSFIAKGVGALAENAVSTQVNSIVNSVNYSADGGWGFDTAGYLTSSFGVGALASYAGSFAGAAVTSGLTGSLEGFAKQHQFDVQKVASFGGGLATMGAQYAISGETSMNILNLDMFGIKGSEGNNISHGLLEVKFGKDGVQTALGSGGVNMSYNAIKGAIEGFDSFAMQQRIRYYEATGKTDYADDYTGTQKVGTSLRLNYSFGDQTQLGQLNSILDGTTQLKVGYIGNEGYTKTTGGIRTVNLGTLGTDDSLDSRLKAGVVIGHEAYRDGYQGTELEQNAETLIATKAHTEMALRVASDSQYGFDFINNDKNLSMDVEKYFEGVEAFANHVRENYNSSGDYYLYDEKTNIVYPDGRYGVYSLQTGELLQASEFEEYDEDGNVTKQLPGSFSMELGKLFGMIPEGVSLEDVNPHHLEKVQKLLAENGYSWDSSEVREFAESVRNGKYVQNLQLPYPMGVDGQIGIQGNAYLATKFGLLSGEGINQTIGLMDFITNTIQIRDKYNNVAGVVSFAYGRNQERTDVINVENLTPENDRLNAGKIVVNQDGFVAMFPLSTTLPDVAQRGEDHAIIQDGTYRYMTEYHYLADGRKWDGLRLFDFSSLTKNLTEADKKNYRSNFPAYYYDNGIKKYTTTDKINDHRSSWKNGYWLTKTEGQYKKFDAGSLGCQLTYGPIYDDYFSLFNRYDLGYYTIYRPFGDTIYDY